MRWTFVLVFGLIAHSSPSQAAISTLAVSGSDATGIAGAKFDSFTLGSLNSNSEVSFLANLQDAVGGVSTVTDQVLYSFSGSGLSLLAREGSGGVPNVLNADFTSFTDVAIDDSGAVLARAALATGPGSVTTSTNQGLWRFSSGGDTLVARTGIGDAPGVAGGQFKSIPNFIRTTENGDTAFAGQMVLEGSVTLQNDSGIWFYEGSTGTLIAREAISPVPGIPGEAYFSLGRPSINNHFQGAARATFNMNNSSGVWRYSGTNGELIARQGVGLAPGSASTFSLFDNPVINSMGQVAFSADLASGSEGLWRYTGTTGELVAIANTGTVPDVPGASFSSFDDVHFSDTGVLVVRAELNTGVGGVAIANQSGIWSFALGGDQLLVRTSSGGVPGVAGANFTAFGEYAANSNGSAIVSATLETGPGGVNSTNDAGLWLFPATGSAQLVARKGDQLADRTIAALSLLSDDFVGRPVRGFNNQNQILFQADFTNGDEGLFLFTPSGQSSADFNSDTFVDATDLDMWQAAYSATAGGDADGDGDSDGADFLAWQRQYTGPGVSASNLTVPESSASWLLLATLATWLPRRLGI